MESQAEKFSKCKQERFRITYFRQSLKKWTCDPPVHKTFSRRWFFETHANRFSMHLQIHLAQPVDNLRQQTLIRNR